MFSPLDDPAIEEWFARFQARLRRLPAEEQSQLHLEVRQHLEALAQAQEELGSSPEKAWETALDQFGDPAVIGERMRVEYQESQSGPNVGLRAIGFGIGLHFLLPVLQMLWLMTPLFSRFSLLSLYYQSSVWYSPPLVTLLAYSPGLLIPFVIGRKYPFQAIRGAFYSLLFGYGLHYVGLLVLIANPHLINHSSLPSTVSVDFMRLFGSDLVGLSINCAIAYLASVAKRGWYRPQLADFKLTLPHKRTQISR